MFSIVESAKISTNNFLLIISVLFFLIFIQCQADTLEKSDRTKEICIEEHFRTVSTNNLRVCYVNEYRNRSTFVWFTIGEALNGIFQSYRFTLRSVDMKSAASIIMLNLTEFTELIDFNNSIRLINFDAGQYEICVEFLSNLTLFIYEPRDGCIRIHVGISSEASFEQSSTPLLIALASAIVLFFVLGLVVQWAKDKRTKKYPQPPTDDDNLSQQPQRSRSSSILSTISLKQQRERLARKLFNRHIDEPRESRMRQWARARAFRHRISSEHHDVGLPKPFRRWSRQLFTPPPTITGSHDNHTASTPTLSMNSLGTGPTNEDDEIISRKVSFNLESQEEIEIK